MGVPPPPPWLVPSPGGGRLCGLVPFVVDARGCTNIKTRVWGCRPGVRLRLRLLSHFIFLGDLGAATDILRTAPSPRSPPTRSPGWRCVNCKDTASFCRMAVPPPVYTQRWWRPAAEAGPARTTRCPQPTRRWPAPALASGCSRGCPLSLCSALVCGSERLRLLAGTSTATPLRHFQKAWSEV